jgi:hypothetical protein
MCPALYLRQIVPWVRAILNFRPLVYSAEVPSFILASDRTVENMLEYPFRQQQFRPQFEK